MHSSEVWRQYIVRSGWEDGYMTRADFHRLVQTDQQRYIQTLARLRIVQTAGGSSPIGPYAVPSAIGVVGAAALGVTVLQHLRASSTSIAPAASEDDEDGGDPPRIWSRLFRGLALAVTYLVGLRFIGFLVATPVFLLALGLLMGSARPIRDAIVGVGLTLGIWLMFTRLLYVSLP
jgi:Tripartite tricarboxylate transporter TctB family